MEMSYFIGQAKTAIDGKGRSSFPREFRQQLSAEEGERFVVTKGPNRTLWLFVLNEYEKFLADLEKSKTRLEAEKFRKNLCEALVELDGQNRILLPKELMSYAGLTTEVRYYATTRGKSLELWNPERLTEETQEMDQQSFDEMFYSIGSTEGLDAKS